MHINRELLPRAEGIAQRIDEIALHPRKDDLNKAMQHIVQVLKSPSKAKLKSALEKIKEMGTLLVGHSGIQRDLDWLSRSI